MKVHNGLHISGDNVEKLVSVCDSTTSNLCTMTSEGVAKYSEEDDGDDEALAMGYYDDDDDFDTFTDGDIDCSCEDGGI